tara:strand:- start:83452 stop:83937 length:486 start_codon:yes stop_codon:yes gene_type:complete
MKKVVFIVLCAFSIIACKNNSEKEEVKETYLSFGEKITNENVLTKEVMTEKFSNLKEGDTINVKFASNIKEVCKKKGCWMKLDLSKEKESMVRFKDYGFFVPLDSDNKEVVVNGKAYVTKISVDQLKHYAKDGGKSEEEIAMITEPEFTYAFEADGVLLKK